MPLSSSPAHVRVRDFLICLSVSNLLFIRRWYDVEQVQSQAMGYYRTGPAGNTQFLATLAAIGITSLALWLISLVVRAFPRGRLATFGRAGFLAMLVLPLETVRRFWNFQAGHTDVGSSVALLSMEALLVAGIVLIFWSQSRILHVAARVALFMAIALPVFAAHYLIIRADREPDSAWSARPGLPMLERRAGGASRRLIWLLFDEFDQRLAFDDRQPGVKLPELDRLRGESMVANRAEQTAGWTMLAVPSLLSGQVFAHSESTGASELLVTPRGSSQAVSWHDEPNVFRRAREMGLNSGIVGWHHPYCRVLGDSVATCLEVMSGNASNSLARDLEAADLGLWRSVVFTFRLRWETLLDIFRPAGTERAEGLSEVYIQQIQQGQFFRIRDRAFEDAVDPRLGLLFVHFPTPHLFAIYDAKRKDFTLSDKTTYFDNLALVDRTVGELRRKLEEAGLWDATSILISSDHGLRGTLWKGTFNWNPEFDRLMQNGSSPTVPFILKLAGRREPAAFEGPFSAVLTGDLAIAALSGEVATHEQAAKWLARHTQLQHLTAR